MKKNYKRAFSYIELIFSMAIIVVIMAMSLPFMTQRNKAPANQNIYGEYRCYIQGDQLFQQARYNSKTLSEPEAVDTCIFNRPNGAPDTFSITLIGGGGGGSSPYFEETEDENLWENVVSKEGGNVSIPVVTNLTTVKQRLTQCTPHLLDGGWGLIKDHIRNNIHRYVVDPSNEETSEKFSIEGIKTMEFNDTLRVVTGRSGNAGSVVQFQGAPLNFTNGTINITKCPQTLTPMTQYCVGQGGEGGNDGENGNNGVPTNFRVIDVNNVNCSNATSRCTAQGGAGGSRQSAATNFDTGRKQGANYCIESAGQTGTFNSLITTQGSAGGSCQCGSALAENSSLASNVECSAPRATSMGAGGGGGAYRFLSDYNLGTRQTVRMLTSCPSFRPDLGVCPNGLFVCSSSTELMGHDINIGSAGVTDANIFNIERGQGGAGGGGAIIIEW